jgi:hypothetical protein
MVPGAFAQPRKSLLAQANDDAFTKEMNNLRRTLEFYATVDLGR